MPSIKHKPRLKSATAEILGGKIVYRQSEFVIFRVPYRLGKN